MDSTSTEKGKRTYVKLPGGVVGDEPNKITKLLWQVFIPIL